MDDFLKLSRISEHPHQPYHLVVSLPLSDPTKQAKRKWNNVFWSIKKKTRNEMKCLLLNNYSSSYITDHGNLSLCVFSTMEYIILSFQYFNIKSYCQPLPIFSLLLRIWVKFSTSKCLARQARNCQPDAWNWRSWWNAPFRLHFKSSTVSLWNRITMNNDKSG